MKKKLAAYIILAIVVLSLLLVSFLTYRVATLESNNNAIATKLSSIEEKLVSFQPPRDGHTPVAGVDFPLPEDGKTPACYYEESQCRGKDGEDSESKTTIEKTIVKVERESPGMEWQLNALTGNFEIKLGTEDFWQILIPCEKFVNGCPNHSPVIKSPLPGLGDL